MASNIHWYQHLKSLALVAGAHAENGLPSHQIFHFNHCSRTCKATSLRCVEYRQSVGVVVKATASTTPPLRATWSSGAQAA